MPAVREAPSYSSTRVQRASRINNIESTRLNQTLQGIERAKQHQCRLTNQDIRLVSLSLDYIQSSSGNSQEAWRPADVESEAPSDEVKAEGPCFLYGERIISRKMKRVQRPMSAVERVISDFSDDCSLTSETTSTLSSTRPKSSPVKPFRRPASAASGWARWRDDQSGVDDISPRNGTSEYSPRHLSHGELDGHYTASPIFAPRPAPREAWENETSFATKKILKAQALAQSGKGRSVYVSAGDVMTAQASRNVRNLARKIRVSSSAGSTNNRTSGGGDLSPSRGRLIDKPPQRPVGAGRDELGRRATLGEIINQHKPTLSAGAWRQHLKQTAVTPMSVSGQRQALLDAKKEINESQKSEVDEKVKSFIKGGNSPRLRRKSIYR